MPPAGFLDVAPILGLLFVEEIGVPLPMFPADGLLVAAGVLAAAGAVPIWLLLPLIVAVDMLGAAAGYLWVRTLRRRALERPATWIERSRPLRAVGDRLRRTGAPGVFLTRLVPGTRVYTTLAAGAIDLRPRSYLAGMLPASLLWVTAVTLLGTVIGSRALPLLARVESLSLDGLALLVAGLVCYLALRHLPDLARRHRPGRTGHGHGLRLPRLLLGLAVDALIVGALASLVALALWSLNLGEPDGLKDVCALVGAVCLLYVLATRLGIGSTTGERLLRIDYRRS